MGVASTEAAAGGIREFLNFDIEYKDAQARAYNDYGHG